MRRYAPTPTRSGARKTVQAKGDRRDEPQIDGRRRLKPFVRPVNWEFTRIPDSTRQLFPDGALRVRGPHDPLEYAADAAANRIVANFSTARRTATPVPATFGRQASTPPTLQAKFGAPAVANPLPGGEGAVSLSPDVRLGMEAGFGTDFSAVKVHAGRDADTLCQSHGARALTHGAEIYMAAGQYRPETRGGLRLLAHELAHVVQQTNQRLEGVIQRDLAVEPTTSDATRKVLSASEIADAIALNQRTITEADEIELLRDILGVSGTPAIINGDFVQAVADFQILHALTPDGKIGSATRRRLSLEILAEAEFLGFADPGELATGVELRADLDAMMSSGNTTYVDWRGAITAATVLQRDVILAEPAFLARMRSHLTTWNDFARCVELLARRAPSFSTLTGRAVVTAALSAAWTDSDVGVNPPLVNQHEEGGWIYLNLITNVLSVQRAPRGAGAAISLSAPPLVADSIVVGMFHTHPNLGPGWRAGPSPADIRLDTRDGVPDIVVGSTDVDVATFSFFQSGPDRRLHLAGNRGLPGAAGGVAPQARADGSMDEER